MRGSGEEEEGGKGRKGRSEEGVKAGRYGGDRKARGNGEDGRRRAQREENTVRNRCHERAEGKREQGTAPRPQTRTTPTTRPASRSRPAHSAPLGLAEAETPLHRGASTHRATPPSGLHGRQGHRPPTWGEGVTEAKEEEERAAREEAGGGNLGPGRQGPRRQAQRRGRGH